MSVTTHHVISIFKYILLKRDPYCDMSKSISNFPIGGGAASSAEHYILDKKLFNQDKEVSKDI